MVVNTDVSARYGKVRLPTGFSMWRVDNEHKLREHQTASSSSTPSSPAGNESHSAIATSVVPEQQLQPVVDVQFDDSQVAQKTLCQQAQPLLVSPMQQSLQQFVQHSPSHQQVAQRSPSHQQVAHHSSSHQQAACHSSFEKQVVQHSPPQSSQSQFCLQPPQQKSPCNLLANSSVTQLDSSNDSIQVVNFDSSIGTVKAEIVNTPQLVTYADQVSSLPFDLQNVQLQLPNNSQTMSSLQPSQQHQHSAKPSLPADSSISDQLLQDLFDCDASLIDPQQSQQQPPQQQFHLQTTSHPQQPQASQQQAFNFQPYAYQPLVKSESFNPECMYLDESYLASTVQTQSSLVHSFTMQQFVEQPLSAQNFVAQVPPPMFSTSAQQPVKLSPTSTAQYSFCHQSEI